MEVKNCGNCYKEVPVGNLLSHETYCFRHYIACPTCEYRVHRYNFNAHIRLPHRKKYCSGCRQLFWTFELDEHMQQCPDMEQDTDIESYSEVEYKGGPGRKFNQMGQYSNSFFNNNKRPSHMHVGNRDNSRSHFINHFGGHKKMTKKVKMH